MKKNKDAAPQFVKSATRMAEWPRLKNDSGGLLPEIAVVGRSNVGKSSLINDLFHAKRLVKVSATPGKTQLINFFTLGKTLSFADLPGYGFARVPDQVRKQWGPMIQEYLTKREELKLILFLFDIRRMPQEDDLHFIDWIKEANIDVVLILTKVDKVSHSELKLNTEKITQAFGIDSLPYIHYSVPKKIGREKLLRMMDDLWAG